MSNSIAEKTVGLYFGSFNPIHNGHLMLAQFILNREYVDEIWFVVSPQNPFKERKNLLDQYARLALIQDCIQDQRRMKASDIEFGLPIPSYTIDTLTYLSEKYDYNFQPILGSDNLLSFNKWKNHTAILENYGLLVYPRKGNIPAEWKDHPKIEIIEAPEIEISSTYIRRCIKEKKEIKFFVPSEVHNELSQHPFYSK